jgi:hypothetical protein
MSMAESPNAMTSSDVNSWRAARKRRAAALETPAAAISRKMGQDLATLSRPSKRDRVQPVGVTVDHDLGGRGFDTLGEGTDDADLGAGVGPESFELGRQVRDVDDVVEVHGRGGVLVGEFGEYVARRGERYRGAEECVTGRDVAYLSALVGDHGPAEAHRPGHDPCRAEGASGGDDDLGAAALDGLDDRRRQLGQGEIGAEDGAVQVKCQHASADVQAMPHGGVDRVWGGERHVG